MAPGVKTDGGILSHPITELDITCLPRDLPEFIAVDVSELNLNESLHLSSIKMPEGVELTATAFPEGEDPTIATISPPKVVEEEIVEEGADQEAEVDAKSAEAEDASEA